MKSLFISFFILLFFSSFIPGVRTVKLFGKSQSGRTIFNAELEDMSSLRKAELIIDNEKLAFTYSDRCYVTFDPEVKVFTLQLESEANGNLDTLRYINFWAIPSSFKEVSNEEIVSGETYKFSAKLVAKDPRKAKVKEYETPTIVLSCILTYSYP